jgi:hypothetical protein
MRAGRLSIVTCEPVWSVIDSGNGVALDDADVVDCAAGERAPASSPDEHAIATATDDSTIAVAATREMENPFRCCLEGVGVDVSRTVPSLSLEGSSTTAVRRPDFQSAPALLVTVAGLCRTSTGFADPAVLFYVRA